MSYAKKLLKNFFSNISYITNCIVDSHDYL